MFETCCWKCSNFIDHFEATEYIQQSNVQDNSSQGRVDFNCYYDYRSKLSNDTVFFITTEWYKKVFSTNSSSVTNLPFTKDNEIPK